MAVTISDKLTFQHGRKIMLHPNMTEIVLLLREPRKKREVATGQTCVGILFSSDHNPYALVQPYTIRFRYKIKTDLEGWEIPEIVPEYSDIFEDNMETAETLKKHFLRYKRPINDAIRRVPGYSRLADTVNDGITKLVRATNRNLARFSIGQFQNHVRDQIRVALADENNRAEANFYLTQKLLSMPSFHEEPIKGSPIYPHN